MTTLTLVEERLRNFLIDRARTAHAGNPETATMTYQDLAGALDPDGDFGLKQGAPRFTRLIRALFHMNSYEVEKGRPMVGALAVSKTTGDSGSGFAGLGRELGFPVPKDEEGEKKFWQAQLDQAIEHWSGNHEDNGRPDDQFAAILTELRTIRKTLQELVHDQAAS